MPKLTIDGREVEVEKGTSVLQACEQLGIEVPRFCYHDRLSVAGNCRMCLVAIEKMPKPVASCTIACGDGMVVHTDTPEVRQMRADVMEMLLLNHPLDCPVCDQGGECDLQDQAVAYGADRGRSCEKRRLVSEKELGPLIKTVMTRCIHCTRCIRFLNEIAGTPELGGLFRGHHMEIDTGTGLPLTSELSGNLADVCPVGALTAKPYAFQARSWELKPTETIDVMDAVGCHIRVETRGDKVMRVLPRLCEDINEEWINDKTRFAFDGLALQRLDRPLLRKDGRLESVSWDEALAAIGARLRVTPPEKMAALAGDLVDAESLFALKSLMLSLGAFHLDCRQDGAAYDVSARAGYIMNTGIAGIEEADAVLLVGVNPRIEATLVNARLRKRSRKGGLSVGLIGPAVDLTYPYRHLGVSPMAVRDLMEGKNPFAQILRDAQKPMLIVGAGALARPDGASVHALLREAAETLGMIRPDWNGFNVLQLAAGRVAGLDLGFVPQGSYALGTRGICQAATYGKIDLVYLLGADEIAPDSYGKAFVIYQGHHGDRGALRADVVLPGAAYTEKEALYTNTEGRVQVARAALPPPGEAKEDWRILRALSDVVAQRLPFDTLAALRQAMSDACALYAPQNYGARVPAPWKAFGSFDKLSLDAFAPAIQNFYMTDPISRVSPTMARCTAEIAPYQEPQNPERRRA